MRRAVDYRSFFVTIQNFIYCFFLELQLGERKNIFNEELTFRMVLIDYSGYFEETMGKKIIVALFLLLGSLTVILVIQLNAILGEVSTELTGIKKRQQQPGIRLAFIYQNNNNPSFWNKIKQGAAQAAGQEGLTINFMEVVRDRELQAADYFHLAVAAGYDGIIIRGDDERLSPLIQEAGNVRVPTLLVTSDLPNSGRIGYVGTDNYRAGYIAGKMMMEHMPGTARPHLAVLSPLTGTDLQMSVAESLKIFGFREAISFRNPIIPIWEKANPTLIDSMMTVRSLLRKYPHLEGIYATYAEGTVAAARVIMEQNAVGKIKIIGHGDLKSIRGYIDTGIIAASVVEYPYRIGYTAVTQMLRYLRKGSVNVATSIDTVVWDRSNTRQTPMRGAP
jgi:ribose transport system substrate-binding protein